jgi:hypothetical protein
MQEKEDMILYEKIKILMEYYVNSHSLINNFMKLFENISIEYFRKNCYNKCKKVLEMICQHLEIDLNDYRKVNILYEIEIEQIMNNIYKPTDDVDDIENAISKMDIGYGYTEAKKTFEERIEH